MSEADKKLYIALLLWYNKGGGERSVKKSASLQKMKRRDGYGKHFEMRKLCFL